MTRTNVGSVTLTCWVCDASRAFRPVARPRFAFSVSPLQSTWPRLHDRSGVASKTREFLDPWDPQILDFLDSGWPLVRMRKRNGMLNRRIGAPTSAIVPTKGAKLNDACHL